MTRAVVRIGPEDHGRRMSEVLALRRLGGAWRERVVRPPQPAESHVLRGFALDVEAVFAPARAAT